MGWCALEMSSAPSIVALISPSPLGKFSGFHRSFSCCRHTTFKWAPSPSSQPRGGCRISKLSVAVNASAGESQPEQPQKKFGLGGPGTWFGFGRKQERQVGRLAMVGFVAAIVMEIITGKGVFGQLGIDTFKVRLPFLAGFTFLLVGGLLGGYVVIQNPPDTSKAPPNSGAGIPRNPLKTFDPNAPEPLTTWTRGGVVDLPSGQKGREPYVSDLDNKLPPS